MSNERVRPASQPALLVPEGHELNLYRPSLEKSVSRTVGGIVVVQLGVSGDDLWNDVETLFDQAFTELRKPSPHVVLSLESGSLSRLFAPHNPTVSKQDRVLVLTAFGGSFHAALQSTENLHRLCVRLSDLAHACTAAPIFVMIEGLGTIPPLMYPLLSSLGFSLRTPADNGDILLDVKRPEGAVISAILGQSATYEPSEEQPRYQQLLNEKAEAKKSKNQSHLTTVIEREIALLDTWRSSFIDRSGPLSPYIARRLNAKLMDYVLRPDDTTWTALNRELLDRAYPLFLIADPKTGSVTPNKQPGQPPTLPVYPDRMSLLWAAEDQKRAQGTFAVAAVPVEDLLGWANASSLALAFRVYNGRQSSHDVEFSPPQVKTLSASRIPVRSVR